MSAFSKYFYLSTVGKKCSDFTHPGITCEHFAFTTFRDGILGGIQYYLPSIIVPALLKWEKWNKEFWIKVIKDYCISIFYGACMMIFVGFGSFCIIYKCIVRHYNIFVFFPCFLGSMFCYFMPKHILEIQSIGAVNMFLDFLVRSSKNPIIKAMRNSITTVTLIFMISSAAIAKVLKEGNIRRYWFLNVALPIASNKDHPNGSCIKTDESFLMNKIIKKDRKICHHPETCDGYIGSEIKRTAILSFLLGLAKFLASESKALKGNCGIFPKLFVKKFDYGFFFFLTIYGGLFRFGNCLLNRYTNKDSKKNAIVSAFFSGISFCLYPKFLILYFAIVRSVQLFGMDYIEKNKDKSEIVQKISKLPISWFVYSVGTAFVYQCRVFFPHITPKYVHEIMRIGTGKRSDTLAKCYSGIMMGLN